MRFGRRGFLQMGGTVAACAGTGCAMVRGGALHPTWHAKEGAVTGGILRVPLPVLRGTEDGVPMMVEPGELYPKILIVQSPPGTWRVVNAACRHWGCTLGWDAASSEWRCPCHGSRYTAEGKLLEGPAEVDQPAAGAEIEGDHLVVRLRDIPFDGAF